MRPRPGATLAYFPNARCVSGPDLSVSAIPKGRRMTEQPRPGYRPRPHSCDGSADDRPSGARVARRCRPVLVDATLGAGGHAELALRTYPHITVIGIDRDESALTISRGGSPGTATVFRFTTHDSMNCRMWSQPPGGPTSMRLCSTSVCRRCSLDRPDRGFAYAVDAPLDMRMDPSGTLTAADVLNTYSHGELARVLHEYGEERFAGKIASAVLREREREPFTNSARLVALLYETIPAATRRTGGHPAKRTFQALRIEVNSELTALSEVLPAALGLLRVGGRVAVMSYQSLEDRIVKREFATRTASRTPPGLPVELPGSGPEFALVTREGRSAPTTTNSTPTHVRPRCVSG